MKILITRTILKAILFIVFHVFLTNATSNKTTSPVNKTTFDDIKDIVSTFAVATNNLDFEENEATLVRKSRETDPSHAQADEDIGKLRTRINTFSENLKRGGSIPTTSGTFVRPSSNSKISMVENELRKIKEDMQALKSLASLTERDRLELNSLQDTIELIQRQFDDKIRELASQIENLDSFVNGFAGLVVSFSSELRQIKTRFEESERLNYQRGVPAEVIQEIKSRNFNSAYEKLHNLNDISKTNYVVHEVYNNNAGNFDLILQFGESVRYVETSFRILKALNYEMEMNGHDDPFKLLRLIGSLEKQVVFQLTELSALKTEALTVTNKIKSLLKDIFVRRLKDALLNKYESIHELADKIYPEQFDLYHEAVKQATQEIFYKVDASVFAKNFKSHNYIGESVIGYSVLFNELRSHSHSDDPAMIDIAFGLKALMDMKFYPKLRDEAVALANNLKSNLPKSLKNLAFGYRVFIKNIARNEYLYAASNTYNLDAARRRALTWAAEPGVSVSQGNWLITREGDEFYIRNFAHYEYLYAADFEHRYDDSRRNVYTWIPRKRVDQGTWAFELSGDNVYIKNLAHREYLFADSDRKLDSGRRHVFTWFGGAKTPDSLWVVEEAD